MTVPRFSWGMYLSSATAVVTLMVSLTPACTAADMSESSQLQQGLASCERVAVTAARLQCFDELAKSSRRKEASSDGRAAGAREPTLPKPQAKTPASNTSGSRSSPGKTSAAALVGKSPKTPVPFAADKTTAHGHSPATNEQRAAKETKGGKRVRKITVHVARATTLPTGKLRIMAGDGMIWDQTQGERVKPPKPGSTIIISVNFMGGHWCQLDRWTAVRCERVDQPEKPVGRPPESTSMSEHRSMKSTRLGEDTRSGPPIDTTTSANSPRETAPTPSASPAPSRFGLQAQIPNQAPSKIFVTVARAGRAPNGKLQLVTRGGSIWNQTEGASVTRLPKPGSKVTITRNFMGGHWCQLSRWTAVRCEKQMQ